MILEIIDILCPRFITEWVALEEIEPRVYAPVCSLNGLDDDERADAVALFKSFTWLGWCVFWRCMSDVYTWEEFKLKTRIST